ncbi:hypothetical protein TrST_g2929 [Triparma strigata]|uniref:Uncharacterized protein n=1 Tax=Triparma strigata TaxID=1606541 RepID=A0A9W7EIR5_9STRA|nr:hypothetical protein TrST_g2929 [Triparma strigata]
MPRQIRRNAGKWILLAVTVLLLSRNVQPFTPSGRAPKFNAHVAPLPRRLSFRPSPQHKNCITHPSKKAVHCSDGLQLRSRGSGGGDRAPGSSRRSGDSSGDSGGSSSAVSYFSSSLPPVFLGLTTGAAIVLLKLSISSLQSFFYTTSSSSSIPSSLIPFFGGAVVVLLTVIPIQDNLKRTLSAISTLSTGNSLGPEGPCIELGETLDTKVIKPLFNTTLPQHAMAAGVSAGFNAPIAGVIYALEVGAKLNNAKDGAEDGGDEYNKLITMFLCSISASLITHFGLGNDLAFNTPASVINSLNLSFGEVIDFSVIGCLCGLGAFLLEQSEEMVKKSLANFGTEERKEIEIGEGEIEGGGGVDWKIFMPMLGGLTCSALSTLDSRILFFGYDTLNTLLLSSSTIPLLELTRLIFLKSVATSVARGTNLVGGVLAPSLFIGAGVGSVWFGVSGDVGVGSVGSGPAYALVGAASFLGSRLGCPIASSVLVFELTRDYDVLIALVAASFIGRGVYVLLNDKFGARNKENQ